MTDNKAGINQDTTMTANTLHDSGIQDNTTAYLGNLKTHRKMAVTMTSYNGIHIYTASRLSLHDITIVHSN